MIHISPLEKTPQNSSASSTQCREMSTERKHRCSILSDEEEEAHTRRAKVAFDGKFRKGRSELLLRNLATCSSSLRPIWHKAHQQAVYYAQCTSFSSLVNQFGRQQQQHHHPQWIRMKIDACDGSSSGGCLEPKPVSIWPDLLAAVE